MKLRNCGASVFFLVVASCFAAGDEPHKSRLELAAESFASATGATDPDSVKHLLEDLKIARAALDKDSKTKWQSRLIEKKKLDPTSDTFDEDLDDVAVALWSSFRKPKAMPEGSSIRIVFSVDFAKEPKFIEFMVSNDVDSVTQYSVLVSPEDADLYIDAVKQPKPGKGKSYRGATTASSLSLEAKAPGFKDFSEKWDLKPPQKMITLNK